MLAPFFQKKRKEISARRNLCQLVQVSICCVKGKLPSLSKQAVFFLLLTLHAMILSIYPTKLKTEVIWKSVFDTHLIFTTKFFLFSFYNFSYHVKLSKLFGLPQTYKMAANISSGSLYLKRNRDIYSTTTQRNPLFLQFKNSPWKWLIRTYIVDRVLSDRKKKLVTVNDCYAAGACLWRQNDLLSMVKTVFPFLSKKCIKEFRRAAPVSHLSNNLRISNSFLPAENTFIVRKIQSVKEQEIWMQIFH